MPACPSGTRTTESPLLAAPATSAAAADSDARTDRAAVGEARAVAKDLGRKLVGIYRDADSGRMVVTSPVAPPPLRCARRAGLPAWSSTAGPSWPGSPARWSVVRRSPAPHRLRTR